MPSPDLSPVTFARNKLMINDKSYDFDYTIWNRIFHLYHMVLNIPFIPYDIEYFTYTIWYRIFYLYGIEYLDTTLPVTNTRFFCNTMSLPQTSWDVNFLLFYCSIVMFACGLSLSASVCLPVFFSLSLTLTKASISNMPSSRSAVSQQVSNPTILLTIVTTTILLTNYSLHQHIAFLWCFQVQTLRELNMGILTANIFQTRFVRTICFLFIYFHEQMVTMVVVCLTCSQHRSHFILLWLASNRL